METFIYCREIRIEIRNEFNTKLVYYKKIDFL